MKLTDALLGEHALFCVLFDKIEEMAATEGVMAPIQSATLILNTLVMSHVAIEEELLFPALVPHLGEDGPVQVMRDEHVDIERALEEIEDAEQINEAADLTLHALSIVRSHFKKEEEVFFEMARQTLDDETLTRLGESWAIVRRVTIG